METYDSNGWPPAQYARNNHLTIDSRVDPFVLVLQINGSIPQPTPDIGPSGLIADASLPRLRLPTVGPQEHLEQLEVPKESSELLVGSLQLGSIHCNGQYQAPLAQYEARMRLAELKLDPPALLGDPDCDCWELAGTIRKQQQPSLCPEMFPLERRNISNDEGLVFADHTRQIGREFDLSARYEKLDVSKEAMNHLALVIRNDTPNAENYQSSDRAMPCQSFIRNLAVTPPISPFIEHEECFIPDVDTCSLPAAFDLSSMLSDDLEAAESAALKKEHWNDDSPMLDMHALRSSPLLDPPNLVVEIPEINSIRIESPLSPITSPFWYADEGANIPTLLRSVDIDRTLSTSKLPTIGDLRAYDADGTLDFSLKAIIQKSAASVMRSIEQEQISITDAIARVKAPALDFSTSEPEWQRLPMDTRSHLKWLYNTYNIKPFPCPRRSQGDSQLRWLPFLKTIDPQTLTEEMFECDNDLSQYTESPDIKEIPTSVNYVWKRQGLAILREKENEECLEEIISSVNITSDLTTLARKRRIEFDATNSCISFPSGSDSSVDLAAPSLRKRPVSLLPTTGSNSTISTLLSNYIDLRTSKRRRQGRSSYFVSTSKPEAEVQPLSVGGSSLLVRNYSTPSKNVEQTQQKPKLQALYPKIDVPKLPTKLIKALPLSRKLFFGLEQLYAEAEVIERDFNRWNTAARDQCSFSTSAHASPLAAEADIIVSPGTGVIITTLLKVVQKPPPGQGGQSSIRERITYVALRYERLIVLVSQANGADETVRDLTSSETMAYAEFIGFTLGLDTKVEVYYVGGGEATLLRWLVFSVCQHASEAAHTQKHLTQDETQWEVFLRRAGLNAYAAQAILGRLKLKDPNTDGDGGYSNPDLVAFITMTDVGRLRCLRDLLGGESVLNRVNKTLANRWR